ncbi:PREDICTED: uncharacterized protein LOC109215958 [Nicotiana attenuata]|uniref:TF-B3 domain-containing protein n=1 Tax=Nicotiana attenuata TaxID=49451 RepID=A0A1J6KUP6_NICAT|nr:PREDICTED: uncharacterized protein LOC109215958 [Nicotiana attenuata]OIT25391.1 hypothetical protein A4A49_28087 [Nicotiana attenuata]
MTKKSNVDVQEKAEAKPTSYTGSRMQNLMTPTDEADSFVLILGHKNVKRRKNINPYYKGDQNMLMYRNSYNVQGGEKEQVMIGDNLMIENKESVTDAANHSKSSKGSGIKNSFKQMMMRIINRGKPAKEEGRVYSVFEKTLTEKDVEGKLLIPAKFARYFPKTISSGDTRRDVKLQFVDPGGRFWDIKWVKDGSQYFFRGKWKDIVAEHELKSGDVIMIDLSHDKHFPIRFKKQRNILGSCVTE